MAIEWPSQRGSGFKISPLGSGRRDPSRNRPPARMEAKSPVGKYFCDVACDITLVSKPLQVEPNGCLLIHVADGEKQANPLQHLQLVLTPSHPFLVWVLEFATMRSSVRSRLAPPNSDSMFSIVSTESHLVCTIFVQPRVFSRNSISPKRSEKDAVRLHPPLREMPARR
jgi:hypothetical protein